MDEESQSQELADDSIINLCSCGQCDYCKIIDRNGLRMIGGGIMEGYCMKCKLKRELENTQNVEVQTKKGLKYMTTGQCKVCHGKVSVMTKKGGIQ